VTVHQLVKVSSKGMPLAVLCSNVNECGSTILLFVGDSSASCSQGEILDYQSLDLIFLKVIHNVHFIKVVY
jgi:hypothetical protein